MKWLMRRWYVLLTLVYLMNIDVSAGDFSGRVQKSLSSFPVQVKAGWNLLSVPVNVASGAKSALYPMSTEPAYIYQHGYVVKDTLEPGLGYWLRFSSPQTVFIEGETAFDRAIPVRKGWNMIGSLSFPVPASLVYSEPAGIIYPTYYRYIPGSGYQTTDTIQPGGGYWVRVSQDGTIYLTAPGSKEVHFSDSLRTAVLDSINAFANHLPHINNNADNLALLNYIRSLPAFEASDTLMDGVWARFTDGRMFMYANDFPIASVPGYPSVEIPKSEQPLQVVSPTDNLPVSSKVWICNALGSHFYDMQGGGVTETVNQLKQWHTMAGYTLAPNASASVGDLKTVSDVGVFYLSAHGAGCYDRDSNLLLGVWSSTLQSTFLDDVFKADLDTGYLVYFSAPDIYDGTDTGLATTHYAITERFVQKYMKFREKTVVFINACWSYYEHRFAEACLAKGAGFYVGWTRTVNGIKALRAARHFFDRMLGTNQFYPETPPQRPFDADLVWNDLILKHYDTSSTKGKIATFTITPTIPSTNLLAPSILQCYSDLVPGSPDFFIDGLFGDPGDLNDLTVKVGTTTLPVTEWVNSTKLRLPLPTQGGNVQVTYQNRKSNVTQYTQWHGVFEYTLLGRGSLKKHIVFNVDFLADLHRFRINIADPPIFGPGSRIVQVLNSSSATYDCSGEYRDPNDNSIVLEKWEGSDTVPLGPDFTFSTTMYDVGNPFGMYLTFTAPYINTNSSEKLSIEYSLDNFTVTLDSSYVIGGGSKSGGDGSTTTAEIIWNTMTPTYPPDPNGVR